MAIETKVIDGKFYIVEASNKEITIEQINGMLDQAENDLLKAQNKYAEAKALKDTYEANMPKPEA